MSCARRTDMPSPIEEYILQQNLFKSIRRLFQGISKAASYCPKSQGPHRFSGYPRGRSACARCGTPRIKEEGDN